MTRNALVTGVLATAVTLSLLAPAAARASDEVVVRPGETLSAIAIRHGVTVSALAAANGIVDPNRIYAGQRLALDTAPVAPSAKKKPASPSPRTYTVQPGDNLWSIARYFKVSLLALIRENGITDPSRVRPGTKLTLPGIRGAAQPKAKPAPDNASAPGRVHTVARGESLWAVGRRYGVTVSDLARANRIASSSIIRVGQRLAIPAGAAPKGAAPAPAPAPAMRDSIAAATAKREPMRRLIAEEAKRARVPVAFVLAVAWQESGWRQDVVSSAGAVGVMQLMPGTADWIGTSMLGRTVKINDARDNVRAGVTLLAHYLDRYDGDRELVLAAYFQGQGAVDRHGIYPVSRPYIASIKALTKLFGG